MNEKCENCKFFSGYVKVMKYNGACRRYPPTALAVIDEMNGSGSASVFPGTLPENWCGEWQPLPEKEK